MPELKEVLIKFLKLKFKEDEDHKQTVSARLDDIIRIMALFSMVCRQIKHFISSIPSFSAETFSFNVHFWYLSIFLY